MIRGTQECEVRRWKNNLELRMDRDDKMKDGWIER